MRELNIGVTGTAQTAVTQQNTAAAMGSGSLPVFATPAMVALMEQAACNALCGALEEGETTVGTALSISHSCATPLSMEITAKATLTKIDRRKLIFAVECSDAGGIIGAGTHERFVVDAQRFMDKTNEKAGRV